MSSAWLFRDHRRMATRVETFFTFSRAPALPALPPPASCLRPGGAAEVNWIL